MTGIITYESTAERDKRWAIDAGALPAPATSG